MRVIKNCMIRLLHNTIHNHSIELHYKNRSKRKANFSAVLLICFSKNKINLYNLNTLKQFTKKVSMFQIDLSAKEHNYEELK